MKKKTKLVKKTKGRRRRVRLFDPEFPTLGGGRKKA